MKRTHQWLSAICFLLIAQSAVATPICSKMLDQDALDKRYKRLAPIYNSVDTGWIFGSDQFENTYAIDDTRQKLVAKIVGHLASQGTTLAMVIPPPRPAVAGQAVVDATIGQSNVHDIAVEAASFHQMIEQLNAAGAKAPDLLSLALSNDDLKERFYFSRDTHWTSVAVAHSALALAAKLTPEAPAAFDPNALQSIEVFGERGSLSDIVRATCNTDPEKEPTPVFDYATHLPSGADLFGDVDASAVLVGTSFSDRYKRDQYQVADAMSAALGQSVTNLSVSGAGVVGPLEAYVLSGQLDAEKPSFVIWEFPYTYELREAHLRQILGALRAKEPPDAHKTLSLSGDKVSLNLTKGVDLVGLRPQGGNPLSISIKLRHNDGSITKMRLARKSRMAEIATFDTWWLDLSGYADESLVLEASFKSKDGVSKLEVMMAGETG